jgi:alkylation response protein AidB-like acyl-CoA dehydrogenase
VKGTGSELPCRSSIAPVQAWPHRGWDYAVEYAKTRQTMGRPIGQHQLIAGMLADMETKCETARGLLYRVGRMIDHGSVGSELTKLSAMAKLWCSDVAMQVCTDAVQILGGYGYVQEHPVERMMRDAKITQIYEGTNQIQRLVIAREMLREQRVSPYSLAVS